MARFGIVLQPSAIRDLDALRRTDAVRLADGLEQFLTNEPKRESKSRIKRLRGISNPDYRLRIDNFRVFYNVDDSASCVRILRIMHKNQTHDYYEEVQS